MAINEKTLQNIITNLISSSMREVREDKDLLDSYSPNQFLSKLNLINHIRSLNILNKVIIYLMVWLCFSFIMTHTLKAHDF